jgi:phosphate transport system substrate-binding protein
MSKKVLWKKLLIGALATVVLGVTGVEPAMASGNLTMSGSTSVYPLAVELTNGYNAATTNDITFTINQGGSGVGITQVANGTVDIGNVSRALKASEISQGLVATTIARDAVAVVINPSNPVSNLSKEEIAAIFTGEITNWSDVGGPNATIVVNTRTAPSGTLDFFKEFFLANGAVVATATQRDSNDALRTAVAANQYAIGFLSMGYLNSNVKAPNLDGQVVSMATARSGQYAAIRPFNMVTLGQPAGNEATFLNWVLSAAGQAIVTQEYLAPLAGGSAAAAKGQVRATRQTRQVR